MNIIEITALENGAHRNQNCSHNYIPNGWAMIPDSISIPNSFPFVDIETEVINGIPTVVSITERNVPAEEEVKSVPSAIEQLRADVDYIAIMTGVEL